jgi:hypothetical protein
MKTMDTLKLAIAGALLAAPLAPGETLVLTSPGPEAIADLGQAVVVLDAAPAGSPTVGDVEVDLGVTHPWIGDLVITLEHEGVTVRLVDRIGLATYPFACGGDDIAATFEDDATVTPEDQCAPKVSPNITGIVAPADALSAFDGLPAAGAWTLTVADAAAFDAGTLDSVTLRLGLVPAPGCVGDVNGDGATDVFDFSDLAAAFGTAPGDPAWNPDADLNGDDAVDVFDFSELAADFGCGGG